MESWGNASKAIVLRPQVSLAALLTWFEEGGRPVSIAEDNWEREGVQWAEAEQGLGQITQDWETLVEPW